MPSDYFGGALALSSDGSTALIGAYGQNSFTGAAYVFKRNNDGSWSQLARLVAPDGAEGDYFGKAVAISGDGNTMLVGAYANNAKRGAAYIFRHNNSNNTWGTAQKLIANDAATNDELGMAVALDDDGNTALVGAFGKTAGGGTAYLFTNKANGWSQQTRLNPADYQSGAFFGFSVALNADGSSALVGAYGQNSLAGAAYLFGRNGTSWEQQQKFTAPDASPNAYFGYAVTLDTNSDTLLIGSDAQNTFSGAAYIIKSNNGNWNTPRKLVAWNGKTDDRLGSAVALTGDGNTPMLGGYSNNLFTGAFYVFAPQVFRLTTPVTVAPSTTFNFTVTALDADGNLNPNYTGKIHFTSSDNAAQLPSEYTFSSTDRGSHTFNSAFGYNGNQTLTATDTNNALISGSSVVNVMGDNAYIYHLPFLANNSNGFSSYVAFQNSGHDNANLSLQYYDANGTSLPGPALVQSCSPFVAQAECLPANPFGDGVSGSGIIVSNQPLTVIVAEGTPYGGSAYAVSQGSHTSLIAPIILHNTYGDFSTRLSVFNTSTTTTNVTVIFYDQSGTFQSNTIQRFSIAPHTTQILDQNQSNLPDGFNGWAQISSDDGSQLVAQVLEQSPNQHFVAIANAEPLPNPANSSTIYAPAIFRGAFGFATGANVVNPSGNPVQVKISYYAGNGQVFAAPAFTLGANSIASIFQGGGGGTGLPDNGLPVGFSGAAIVEASGGVTMLVNESGGVTPEGIALSGVYAAANSGSNMVNLPVMANGGFGYTTGATIFNTSNHSVSGNIQYYDIKGAPYGLPQTFTITAHASQLEYQGAPNLLPSGFYGTAVVSETSGSSDLIVTTNAESGLFYTYTEPNQ
jgi:hypothetical protein